MEKEELDISTISLEDIEERIQNWEINEKYYNYFPNSMGLQSSSEVMSRKLKSSIGKRGLLDTLRLSTSQTLITLGKKIGSKVPD